jgi:hypothetical protein
MISTITIGDLHGNDRWKDVDPTRYDRIIFLGDYLDSFYMSDDALLRNFREVIAFRESYPDRVVLLLGNHEISYLGREYRCSGYRGTIAGEVQTMLTEYRELFAVAWQHGRYLWTHAGIDRVWFERHLLPMGSDVVGRPADTLQRLYEASFPPLFEVGWDRGGRQGATGGPFWVDMRQLITGPLGGYHQIVGHNPVPTIRMFMPGGEASDTSVTFCDCIERGDGTLFELNIPVDPSAR